MTTPTRSMPASATGATAPVAEHPRVELEGVTVDDIGFDAAVDALIDWARDGSGGYMVTTNVDYLVRAHRDPAFRRLLDGARLRVPDGMGVVYGARLAGRALRGTVTGRLLPQAVARRPDAPPIALMGGLPGAGEPAVRRLESDGAKVALHVSPPMGFEIGGADDMAAVEQLRNARPGIVFVGLGSPKQDRWMAAHAADLPGVAMVGIGAGIDVLGGMQPEAPAWMTRVGVEWAYRLFHDPRRLARRYLWDDPRFFWWMWRARRTAP